MDPGLVLAASGFAFTLISFLGGLVWQAGRLSARVDHLEGARAERRADTAMLSDRLKRIEQRLDIPSEDP
jgi:hypothetical protein